ncbi:MAG TPA: ATP-binding protein [Verrucomicrobiae bacterium]|jgi:signal transduction histidine kinase
MLKANFRAKVLLPVIVVMILLVTITVFVVNRALTQQFQNEAQSTLTTANRVFNNLQGIRSDDLLSRFRSLPNEPRWRAAFLSGDVPTLHQPLLDLLREEGVNAVFYTSASGEVLDGETDGSALSATSFESAAAPSVKRAMVGTGTVDTVSVGNKLYDVISVPVQVDNDLIGVLTLGSEIGGADATKFSQLTSSQIILFAGGYEVASTLTNLDAGVNLAGMFADSFSANKNSTGIRQVLIGRNHYFYAAGQFDSLNGDKSLDYVLLSSYEDSLTALHKTQLVLLIVSLCAILFGAAVVWFLITKVTQPLSELRDSAEAVGRGDFSRQVPIRSDDEVGELAGAFNRMTKNVRESRAQLEQTVSTLKNTQEQLIQSEKLSAVGEFVAGVAHELNNPLAAVMGFSEMLREADVDAKYRRHLDLIFKAAQRCQKIVQSLLSFARHQKPERKPVSANELVEAVLEIVAYPLRTSNVEVITGFQPNMPAILADSHQIQQVLLNIINNARQAMEGHQRDGQIKINTAVSEAIVRITIQDNGPGIPDENLRRIFDPFFTTKEVGKGTGLGLSLCYGIIKEHGGNISATSRPGEGATFVIELPIAQGAPLPVEDSKSSPAAKTNSREGAGRKILVIDDEESVLQMVYQVLTSSGYHVHTVANGETALEELQNNSYDAIFCDWKMPGLNGREVYERVRGTSPDLCRRMIFITGDVINETMREFLEKEKRPCLAKPFTLSEVRTMAKNAIVG